MQINVLGTNKLRPTQSETSAPAYINVYTRRATKHMPSVVDVWPSLIAVKTQRVPLSPGCILKIEPTADGNLNIEVVEEFT